MLETEPCAQMDAGFKELEHRWEEQQLHIREQAQQIQDTEYLGLLGSPEIFFAGVVSVCVCVFGPTGAEEISIWVVSIFVE